MDLDFCRNAVVNVYEKYKRNRKFVKLMREYSATNVMPHDLADIITRKEMMILKWGMQIAKFHKDMERKMNGSDSIGNNNINRNRGFYEN